MTTQPGMMPQHPNVYNAISINWSLMMFLGVMMLILGTLAVIFPAATSVSVSLFLGILLLIGGAGRVIGIFGASGWADFLLRIMSTAVFLAAGVLLLTRPIEGTLTVTLLLGLFFIIQGAVNIVTSLMSRGRGGWGWVLFNGLLAFVLGAMIAAELPSSAAWAIGLLVGVYLIFDGWALIIASWAKHAEEKTA